MYPLENTILHLLGFAGTGKLTIAREIVAAAPFRLVDNHLVNNVVFSLIFADGKTKLPPSVWERVGDIRETVIRTIRKISPDNFSFVFTNEMIEGTEKDERTFEKIRSLAEDRGALYLPVRLLISETELCRRIAIPERAKMHKTTSEEAAIINSRQNEVLIPKSVPYVDLDVTNLEAHDAARQILSEARARRAHG